MRLVRFLTWIETDGFGYLAAAAALAICFCIGGAAS